MNAAQLTHSTGTAIKQDPAGSAKAFFYILIMLLLVFLAYKFLKGIGKTADLIGDLVPTSEKEKIEIISNPVYQQGIKWLDPRIGIETIVRKGGFKTNGVTAYLATKKYAFESLSKAAEDIWNAKLPFYIDQTVIYNTFSSLPSRAAVSLMAMRFNDLYEKKWNGMSLSAFLSKYLKMNELENVTRIIMSKPEL